MLPAAGMHSVAESSLYLFGFGVGTVVSMMGIAWLLGVLAPHEEREHAPTGACSWRRRSRRSLLGVVWIGLALAGVDLDAG